MITQHQINQAYDRVDTLAMAYVEQEVLKILRRHPNLEEFSMGMGCYSFTYRIGSRNKHGIQTDGDHRILLRDDFPVYLDNSPLVRFLDRMDPYLRITGSPLRLTAAGRV